jgi:hypothetical protein
VNQTNNFINECFLVWLPPGGKAFLSLEQKLKGFGMLPTEFYGHGIGMNESFSKEYTVDNGRSNIRKTGTITKWMNKTDLSPIWNSDFSNQILGTDGGSLPPLLDSNLPLFIFVDNMCRTLDFVTNGKEVLVGSVKTWKYSLPKSALDTNQEKNKGFCVGEPDSIGKPRQCLPTGTLSLTTCLKETVGLELPMVMSKPHFLDAEKSLLRHFTGLNPNPKLHQTELYVEPLTGLMLKAAKKLQANFEFGKGAMEVSNINGTMKKGAIVPLYYVSQEFEASEAVLKIVDGDIVSPLVFLLNWPVYLVGVSVFGTFVAFIMGIIIHTRRNKKEKKFKDQEQRFIEMG